MSPSLANFVFESANFLLLAVLLGWVLFKPVRTALDAERTARSEAESLLSKREAAVSAAAADAAAAREVAEAELDAQRKEVVEAAKREAKRIVEEARARQHADRERLRRELDAARGAEADALRADVAKLAGASVRRLLSEIAGPQLDEALARSACDAIARLSPEARRSAVVESAMPLESTTRALLEKALGGAFEARVDASLGAGVRITTTAGQVDATASAFARHAERQVRDLATRNASETSVA